jgi:hypothetical protein
MKLSRGVLTLPVLLSVRGLVIPASSWQTRQRVLLHVRESERQLRIGKNVSLSRAYPFFRGI